MLTMYPYIPAHILDREVDRYAYCENIDYDYPGQKYFKYYQKKFRYFNAEDWYDSYLKYFEIAHIIAAYEFPIINPHKYLNRQGIDYQDCMYIGVISPDTNILIYNKLLEGANKQQICKSVENKLITTHQQKYNETLNDPYLLEVFFGPVGFIVTKRAQYPNLDKKIFNWDITNTIIQKQIWQEGAEDLYNSLKPRYVKDSEKIFIINELFPQPFTYEISEKEKDFVLNYFNNTEIKDLDESRLYSLSNDEISLIMLVYSKFRAGEYPMDIKWSQVCATL